MFNLTDALATPCSEVNVFDQALLGSYYRIITNKGKAGQQNRSLRSLVCSGGKILSIGPPSAECCSKQEFIAGSERVEEIVDGTMLNLFWNRGWQVATRSLVGGANRYGTTGLTFAQLLNSAIGTEADHATFYHVLDRVRASVQAGQLSLSFVLQHQENLHIVPVPLNRLVLVGAFITHQTWSQPFSCESLDRLASMLPSTVVRPQRFVVESVDDVETILSTREMKGLFAYLDTWNRKKLLSPWYCKERQRVLDHLGN